jgi:ribosome-interacting GTPase 1
MPANLPPQYFEAEKKYRMARDTEEKLDALQQMLAIMPHHKGTDKLHADLRKKIAKLSQEAEKRNATARRAGFYIDKEGAAQVMLVGHTNVGKSQLLISITEATSAVAPYPFTTKMLIPGMMKFENVQIQLIDTPPIEHKNIRTLLGNSLRRADIIAIVIDLGSDPILQLESTFKIMKETRIEFINNGQEITPGSFVNKALIIANKDDVDDAMVGWKKLKMRYDGIFPVASISAREGHGLEELKKTIFQALDIIRVYTKIPGSKVDLSDPMIMKRGDTVEDAAESVHKDFRQKLKYAVVWGSGVFDGQRASKRHVLQDGDVIEFHI